MTIACIGDSITWGFTILKRGKYSYPAVLQALLGESHEVHNFGFNNATASAAGDIPYVRRKVWKNALALKPDAALVMLGTNDTKPINYDAQKFAEGYTGIIRNLLESGSRVFLMTPPHILNRIEIRDGLEISRIEPAPIALREDTLMKRIIPVIRKTAETMNLPLIEINDVICDISQFNDGIHPNREGAGLIAATVYKQLVSYGLA